MLTKRFDKELYAWAIAIIMGLSTFLLQSGHRKSLVKVEKVESSPSSVRPEKNSTPWLYEEVQNTAILLDNSITE